MLLASHDLSGGDDLFHRLTHLAHDLFSQYEKIDLSHFKNGLMKKSHTKYVLHAEETRWGQLVFEVILFKKGIPTGAHTHPRFMFDKIIRGQLEEIQYQKKDKLFFYQDMVLRQAGDTRSIHCQDLFPHDVKALDDDCLCLHLSLGEETVEGISVDRSF